ncbi:MAG: hypothetical protein NTX28_10085 [Novosphingobium sp.]|nr:hypothetical protein [Novosphingobium sp.]
MDIKPKFTPGPYRIDDHSDDCFEIVGRPTWPCTRFGVKGEWGIARTDDLMCDYPEEAAANARLLAASHQLFWFVAAVAKKNPVFANSREKERIAEARRLIKQVLS